MGIEIIGVVRVALCLLAGQSPCHAGGRESESGRAGESRGFLAQRLFTIFLSDVKSPLVAFLVSVTRRIWQNRLTVKNNCFADRIAEECNEAGSGSSG